VKSFRLSDLGDLECGEVGTPEVPKAEELIVVIQNSRGHVSADHVLWWTRLWRKLEVVIQEWRTPEVRSPKFIRVVHRQRTTLSDQEIKRIDTLGE
jgi:hypothetical protein